MIKYIGKYYKGKNTNIFINGFETIFYYDEYYHTFLEAILAYYIDGTTQIYSKKSYNNENQFIEAMKYQLKQIDFEALKKDRKALEEYQKYNFFLNYEEELNKALKEQSIPDETDIKMLPQAFITINELDCYTIEDLQAILSGTYGQSFKISQVRKLLKSTP